MENDNFGIYEKNMRQILKKKIIFLLLKKKLKNNRIFVRFQLCPLYDRTNLDKANLDNMNFDCQEMILEQMSIFEVATMLDVNTNLKYVAEGVMRRKLTNKKVIFSSTYYNHTKHPNPSDYDYYSVIEFKHLPTIAKILRHFGHLISRLYISNHMSLPKMLAKRLYQLVNTHCADTLIELTVRNQNKEFFVELEKPFKNVERLAFEDYYYDLNKSKFRFGALFPNLKILNLKLAMIYKLNLSEEHVPHLEELIGSCEGNHEILSLKQVLLKNPQIKRLKLSSLRSELLKFISDHMPNLDELDMGHSNTNDIDQFSYSFNNLKKFNAGGYYFNFPTQIHFGQLQDLQIFLAKENNHKLIQLILDNKDTLKRAMILTSLSNTDILQLINGNLSLIDIQFSCDDAVLIENVFQLIESSEHLMKLHISFDGEQLKGTAFGLLNERFGNEWTVKEISYTSLIYFIEMQRK